MVQRAPGAGDAVAYDVSGRVAASLTAALTVGVRATAADKRARRKAELARPDATDILHDFAFPTLSHRIKLSPDQRFLFASGTYPPQIHVYDTDQLSLKFKRHLNAEILDFQILEEDWRKFALLSIDRTIDIHSPFGSHFRTRIPRPGRDILLHRGTAELYVCGASPDVWRLNLEYGRFQSPLLTRSGNPAGNNVCAINPVNALLAFGGETGLVDIWDPRVPGSPAATLNVAAAAFSTQNALLQASGHSFNSSLAAVTALCFDPRDGLSMAVGTSTGHSLLFDLRSPKPSIIRDQSYGLPIKSISIPADGKHCISADAKSIKVWDRYSGRNMVAVEPDVDINHLCSIGDSGVLCVAVEDTRVRSYYIPALGPAPRWCSFLDSVTEELEDRAPRLNATPASNDEDHSVYENYKFVSRNQLEGLGLAHLLGTDMLKPYMHGYFVHIKLYRRAVDVASPFAYDIYRRERAKQQIEARREGRISKVRKTSVVESAKVNQALARQLAAKAVPLSSKVRKSAIASSILEDPRFAGMFQNAEFAVDENAERFQQLNPSGISRGKATLSGRNADISDSDDDDLGDFEAVDDAVPSDIENFVDSSSDDELNGTSSEDDSEEHRPRAQRVTRMYALKDGPITRGPIHDQVRFHKSGKSVREKVRRAVPLGKRVSPGHALSK